MEHGIVDGVLHPIPGEAYLPCVTEDPENAKENIMVRLNHVYEWLNVAVTDYSPETRLWHVLTLDGLQRTFQIPRIYVMFKAEDPEIFGQRIKAALDERERVQQLIR